MFSFFKEKMPSETQIFNVPEVGIDDVENGCLNLTRYCKKFDCKWMKEQQYPGLAALVICNDLFGLIEILPHWEYKSPLTLVVEDCPNFEGAHMPSSLKTFRIRNCPRFTGEGLTNTTVGSLFIDNCKGINLSMPPLPIELGRLVIYRSSNFSHLQDDGFENQLEHLTKRMISKGFEHTSNDEWIEYTNPDKLQEWEL